MIVVDTSVWIEFFRHNAPIFAQLRAQIEDFQVLAAEWVFAELLQGAKNKSELSFIMEYWRYLPKVNSADIWIQAGKYAQEHKLFSKGVGLIDAALIVSAKRHKATIWSHDKKLLSVLTAADTFSA